jgi:hypothetical protein
MSKRLTISNLTSKLKEIIFDYDGDEVSIKYNPMLFTKAYREKIAETIEQLKVTDEKTGESKTDWNKFNDYRLDILSELVKEWNIFNEDGSMLDINRDVLQNQIPESFINGIWNAIFDEVSSPLTKKNVALSA